jgi:chemotaxis protein methyltransferase CheR
MKTESFAALNSAGDSGKSFSFTRRDFERVRVLIHKRAGISLAESKQEMVYSRLARRLRARGMVSFADYLDRLESGRDDHEWTEFINALTTNLTSFFREAHHFPLLAEHALKQPQPLTVWCSAASTGEEPYSIAMTLCEAFNTLTPPVTVVATDIDTNVLEIAAKGIYPMARLDKMDKARVQRFFLKGKGERAGLAMVRPELQRLITFKPLNLLASSWPVSGPFDVIFCRNVMIYFDKPTQSQILSRFARLMSPQGLLFAGHSENFLYATDALKLRSKTVYELAKSHAARESAA